MFLPEKVELYLTYCNELKEQDLFEFLVAIFLLIFFHLKKLIKIKYFIKNNQVFFVDPKYKKTMSELELLNFLEDLIVYTRLMLYPLLYEILHYFCLHLKQYRESKVNFLNNILIKKLI